MLLKPLLVQSMIWYTYLEWRRISQLDIWSRDIAQVQQSHVDLRRDRPHRTQLVCVLSLRNTDFKAQDQREVTHR